MLWGLFIGLVGGFFGAGGGCLAVALLQKQGLPPKDSHAASLALMLPISAASLGVYAFHGSLPWTHGIVLLLPALIGSALGAWALKKIPLLLLKFLFSSLILYSSVRILLS